MPSVESVSPQEGNLGGQLITIKGKGFSGKKENNTIDVDGNTCTPLSATSSQIECILGMKNDQVTSKLETNSTNQTNSYISGTGFKYARYRVQDHWGSISHFVEAVNTHN